MNEREQKMKKTSTFEFQRKNYMTLKIFAFQEKFMIDTLFDKSNPI